MSGEQQIPDAATDEWAWSAAGNAIPRSVDVVIIGGGIVGCSAAYFLARQGVSVALFEKGRIAGEQSGRNWGWVRQQGRSPIELPLMIRSLRGWQELPGELGELFVPHRAICNAGVDEDDRAPATGGLVK